MKNRIYIFFLLVVLASCLSEQTNELNVASCTDGILNQDEEAVDCGGRCFLCEEVIPVVAPCAASLVKNRFTIDGSDIWFTADDFTCDQESDSYKFFFYKNYREITIRIDGFPSESKIYPVGQTPIPQEGYSNISMIDPFSGTYRSSGGDVYVTVADNKLTIEFCSVTMVNMYTDPIEISGRAVCE